MSAYFVIKKETCPGCGGTKVEVHPSWISYYAWERQYKKEYGEAPSYDNEKSWWFDAGYSSLSNLPKEEEKCSLCFGLGMAVVEVELSEALKDLGIDFEEENPFHLTGDELKRAVEAKKAGG